MKITKSFNKDIYYNQPLIESNNFKVVPSVGSMVEGWVLLIPKKHYISFSEMSSSLLQEAEELGRKIILFLTNKYNNGVISFENGSIQKGCKNGCSVDYAHIHFIPLKNDVKKIIDNEYANSLSWHKINSLNEITDFQTAPYFYINIDGRQNITNLPYSISQLIRKGLANELGITKKFDWKEYSFEENIRKTIKKFYDWNND